MPRGGQAHPELGRGCSKLHLIAFAMVLSLTPRRRPVAKSLSPSCRRTMALGTIRWYRGGDSTWPTCISSSSAEAVGILCVRVHQGCCKESCKVAPKRRFWGNRGGCRQLERAGRRGSESRSGPGSRPSGRGCAVGLSEAASNSSRRAGGRVQAAGGTITMGGSDPVGALAAARWSERSWSRRSTMLPPPVSWPGLQRRACRPSRRAERPAATRCMAEQARSCCHSMAGRLGRRAKQSRARRYWIRRSRCLCS